MTDEMQATTPDTADARTRHAAVPGDDSRHCAICRWPITRLALVGYAHDGDSPAVSNAEARRTNWLREQQEREGGR